MRLFEYNCEKHGLFEEMRPAGLRKHPAPCPSCGKLSPRAFSVPRTAQISSVKKSAIERNIKSQFEPHICGPSCGHEELAAAGLRPLPKQIQKPRVQSYNGPRSWVIEHAV